MTPQHPLEGDPTAGQSDEILVARLQAILAEEFASPIGETQLLRPVRKEFRKQVRGVFPQEIAKSGKESVRVPRLGRTLSLPAREGLLRPLGERGRVRFQDGHPVVSLGKSERRAQSRDRTPDHDRMRRAHVRPSITNPSWRRRIPSMGEGYLSATWRSSS
jgi:hypothetical protein